MNATLKNEYLRATPIGAFPEFYIFLETRVAIRGVGQVAASPRPVY